MPLTVNMSKTFSQDDVAKHNKATDLYIVVDEDVYDLTAFQDEHPGKYHLPTADTIPTITQC